MKKLGILIFFFFLFYLFLQPKAVKRTIPEQSIRLRVLPNSNSFYDQSVKALVKEELQESMYHLLKDTKGVENARSLIVEHLPEIDSKISDVLKKESYSLEYTLDYGFHYFPEKEYGGITYEEGNYESLLVTLGRGEGDNWWCVMFPPLCLVEAEESDTVEYQFWIQEMIEKYL